MAKDNITKYILLGLLSHEPMSGYDMKKRIDTMINKFWSVGYGQIYPTLNGLEEDGLIKKVMSETSKGPTRNVYAITSAGTEHLEKWLLKPEEREYTRYEILLKLFFGGKLDPEVTIHRIEAFARQHEQDLRMLDLFGENLKQVMDKDSDHLYYYMTVRFGQCVYKAYLDWAKEALAILGAKQKESEDESNE
jgi:DNA-binding PadR family transcriptional regulator